MKSCLYLLNKTSNNPGNHALLEGCIKIVNRFVGMHHHTAYDLDLIAYGKQDPVEFVHLCNSYDLIVVAGLIIFNGQVHYHHTGCKINIPISYLDQITSKVLFLGVSSRIWSNAKYHHSDQLSEFTKFVFSKHNWHLIFRDDGTKDLLKSVTTLPGDFQEILDPATFAFEKRDSLIASEANKLFINLNGEDFASRFPDPKILDTCLHQIHEETVRYLDTHYNSIVLIPHGPDDLQILAKLYSFYPPFIRHSRLEFAALHDAASWRLTYDRYKKEANYVLSMRIHSMNPSVAMGIPTFVISSSYRISSFCSKYLPPSNYVAAEDISQFSEKYHEFIRSCSSNIYPKFDAAKISTIDSLTSCFND